MTYDRATTDGEANLDPALLDLCRAPDESSALRVERPANVDDVRQAVCSAAERGLAIVATGLGGHLAIGAAPARCGVLLRLDRLSGILDHQPADMTVTAAAGCPLTALDATLAEAGQWLPLDPPLAAATTVGGLIAANLSGPLRASQGTVRDLLIGIETVASDGALVRGGGRVVKNVAGYDLPKLHVGALGSLGVIVAATFKVRPRPASERALRITCDSARQAGEIAFAARDAVEPLWLEIVAGDGRAPAAGDGGAPVAGEGYAATADDGFAVVAGAGGLVEEVAAAIERWSSIAASHGLASRFVEEGAAARGQIAALAAPTGALTLKASTLPTRVGETIEAIAAAARAQGVRPAIVAHAASGVVRAISTSAEVAARLVRQLRPPLEASGGFLVVERADAAAKLHLRRAGVDVWGDPGPGVELMRRVKAALDPAGLLAPGRLPGGI